MYENRNAPVFPLNDRTLVFDVERQRQVAWLDGRLPLPSGSQVELFDPDTSTYGTATVTGIRLLAGSGNTPNQVCLDCTVDDRWWKRFDERDSNQD